MARPLGVMVTARMRSNEFCQNSAQLCLVLRIEDSKKIMTRPLPLFAQLRIELPPGFGQDHQGCAAIARVRHTLDQIAIFQPVNDFGSRTRRDAQAVGNFSQLQPVDGVVIGGGV